MEGASYPPVLEGDGFSAARLIGDFEMEVKLRTADYKADLKDAMKQVYNRCFAVMRQQQEQPQCLESQLQPSDKEGGAQSGDIHRPSEGTHVSMKDHVQEAKDSVVVSASPINSLRLKRMERQLSKKRQRFLRLVSSCEHQQQVNLQGEFDFPPSKRSDDAFWGELVSQRQGRRRRSVSAMDSQLPTVVNFLPRSSKKRNKKMKISASGRLSHVHRDLNGGGDSAPAFLSTTRLAARQLLKASLLSDGTRRTLRAHARLLVLALMYAAAASIAIRLLTWALWIRR
jgi:hypothetical protein